jgi:putative ABC transport system permease protein
VLASAENFPGVGPALKNEFSEVEDYARLYNLGYKNNVIITNEEATPQPIAFKQRRFLYAEPAFLPLMGYPMLSGDARTALAEPLTAVISEEYARKYFGSADPIGKTLHMQDDDYNNELVKVTGVFKNLPPNTHLKFDILFSYSTLYGRNERAPARYGQSWQRKDMYTFVRLKPGADIASLEARFPAVVDKYNPGLKDQNRRDALGLQPLTAIHLNSDLAEEPETNGDARLVFFMGMIGLFVLFIAWINYVNLATARAVGRAQEVGVRKVAGAMKRQLVGQFMVEAALVNLFSVLFSMLLVVISLPLFNNLSGLPLQFSNLLQPWFLALTAAVWALGSLFSGFYPAWVLSSFRPLTILKGKLQSHRSGVWLRKVLVVAQFSASVLLIIGTITIYRQLNYMLHSDLGVQIDQVLTVERPGIAQRDRKAFNSAIDVFRAELAKSPDIEAVTASGTVPGKKREYKSEIKRLGAPANEAVTVRSNSMDYDFLNVFKMKLLAGRNFSREFTTDPDTAVLITQETARLLGYKNPEEALGQTLSMPEYQWNPIVVGVINDYHQVSLKKALDPSIFSCSPYYGEFYSMRIRTDHLAKTLEHVRQSWTTAFPGNPFEFFFLDDYFNRQYENERRFGKLSMVLSLLAIFIGCLGLFGLSGYTIVQRTKEIGIRKVLGASVSGITSLLAKDFLRLVLVAIFIASPLAYWAMYTWLQDFAYRIHMPWWVFVLAGTLALLVAFLTVSFQSIRAALANPVKSLRSE